MKKLTAVRKKLSMYLVIGTVSVFLFIFLITVFTSPAYAAPPVEYMNITYDTETISGVQASSSNYDWQHTIGNGSSCVLVVSIHCQDATDEDRLVSSVTWNGSEDLIKAESLNDTTNNINTEIWYRLNPSLGTSTIEATHNGICDTSSAEAISFFGVRAISATARGSGNGTASRVKFSTNYSNSVIIDSIYSMVGIDMANDATQTLIGQQEINWGVDRCGSSYKSLATAGNTYLDWTWDGSASWVSVAVELVAATESFVGGAIRFYGDEDYGSIANFSAIDSIDGTCMIEGWLRYNYGSNFTWFYGLGDDTPFYSIRISSENEVDSTGINFTSMYSGNSADGYTGAELTLGNWHHIAYVVESGEVSEVYVDGVEASYIAQNTPSGTAIDTSGYYFLIGKDFDDENDIDGIHGGYIRVWNKARTAAEIASNKNFQLDSSQPENSNLIINLKFEENTGNTIDNEATPGADMSLFGDHEWVNYSGSKLSEQSLPFLPSPWQSTDVGSPVLTGTANYSNSTFTISGSGNDIWGSADQFHYVHQPLIGDGEIIARVTSQTNTNPWAKAGAMIKESTIANSNYGLMAVTPGNGYAFQYNFTGHIQSGSYSFPNAWIRLTRTSNLITAYTSSNGVNWTQAGAATLSLSASSTIGLFVTAHDGGLISTAEFDNVSVNTGPPTNIPPTALDQNISTVINASTTITLTATDSDGPDSLAYSIVASTSNGILTGAAPDLIYTPNTDYIGPDSFSFLANDGLDSSNIATITIDVLATSTSLSWQNTDIGSPALTGSVNYTGSIITVSGSGNDIWGSADQLHYVYQPLIGDSEIIARVTSQTNTNSWAKAGVMIKESTTAGTQYALMAVTPGNGYAFQYNFTGHIPGGSYSFPNAWVRLTRTGNLITAYTSPNGVNWTQAGTATLSLPANASIGLFVTAHDDTLLSEAVFDNVSVNPIFPPDPLPPPWQNTDVGSPILLGVSSYTSGMFSVTGAGDDIWGSADQFHYVYQPLSGDGEITARISAQTNTNNWAKAGVIIKESTTAQSSYALIAVTPANGYAFQYNFTGHIPGGGYSLPNAWVRLTRVGNLITAYTSPDGTNWTQAGTVSLALPTNATIGLFVTAHDSGLLSTAEFQNVSIVN